MMETNKLQFFNGVGGFGENGKTYVVKLEKEERTPAPWVNVIANPEFGFIVSESGGGYTWKKNSREYKLTNWSNDPVGDEPSEVFYVSDESKDVWSMTPLPIREAEPYIIEHGFGYTSFKHKSHEIEQELIQFVPITDPVKISLLRFRNEGSQTRMITLTYYITPVLGVSMEETEMHLTSAQTAKGALLIENPYNREFPDQVCFMDASVPERTVSGDRKEFFGQGGMMNPEALRSRSLSGVTGAGYTPCGAIQVKIKLEANETMETVFMLGAAENHEEAAELSDKYKTVDQALRTLDEVCSFWQDKLEAVNVRTPDTAMNIMLNGWLKYQVVSCRLFARSGFYQAGGAFGFRDQLQDILSVAATWPTLARTQIMKHAAHQFEEGDVLHWWHEPTGKGTRTRISDDFLWLPYVTAEYITITGDFDILSDQATYLQDEPLKDHEMDRYCQPGISAESYPLYDHCMRALKNALRFGEHKLPLIKGGDWNDGMNNVGSAGKGESVWLGWFLFSTLQKFIPLCREMGDGDAADEFTAIANDLKESIDRYAWDGNWYVRAFFDDGTPVGSATNAECKMDSLAQSWSVLSGAGDSEKSTKAMLSLENYLIMEKEGLIKLLTPPFNGGGLNPGYIRGYLPGVRENGGQYTHAAAWTVSAFAKLGDGNKAYHYFRMLNPINHSDTEKESWIYKVEPYVMAADVYSEYPHIGRGGWTWYTGSAGWMYKAGLESILGFYKQGDRLLFDPRIPEIWEEYFISYKYLETLYEIKVENPQGLSKGVLEVYVDRALQEDHYVKLANDGLIHEVQVLMGK